MTNATTPRRRATQARSMPARATRGRSILAALSTAIALCLALGSCATVIPVQVEKPPLLDMTGVRRIAVLPFGYERASPGGAWLDEALLRVSPLFAYRNPLEKRLAREIADSLTEILLKSEAYELIGVERLSRSASGGQELSSLVDAYVVGEIVHLSTHEREGQENVKNSSGVPVATKFFERTVRLEFIYRVIRAADGGVIGMGRKGSESSDKRYGPQAESEADSEETLARRILASEMRGIARELAPWRTLELRGLKSNKSKNPRIEAAEGLIKDKRYREAKAILDEVFARTGDYAAGFNRAILAELLGEYEDAIRLMRELAEATGRKDAGRELARMEEAKRDADRLRAGH